MNGRIRELALKYAQQLDWDPPADPKTYTFTEAGIDKFAKSIVEEMFTKIEDEQYEIYEPVVQKVKGHFGMKE